eukprot:TRINITY_DN4106_c0_g1_i4.p1 TRINITY_DN4106_c0_g1~~TRINITY_DN4106_c0_g1_i4.p1  ORF type:complete len:665 (-),score=148.18 TRINITY_DN4106_c0_g1_i4:169-2163(-)
MGTSHSFLSPKPSILFMGPANSGKTTLIRQLQLLFRSFPISIKDHKDLRGVISKEIIEGTQLMIEENKLRAAEDSKFMLSDDSQALLSTVMEHDKDSIITPTVGKALEALWKDPAFKLTVSEKQNPLVSDSLRYYLNDISIISSPTYEPTVEHGLLTYRPTVEITRTDFAFKRKKVTLVDCGDISLPQFILKLPDIYRKAQMVVFVCDMNRFDESLPLMEQLEKELALTTPLMIFFNKRDILEEKNFTELKSLEEIQRTMKRKVWSIFSPSRCGRVFFSCALFFNDVEIIQLCEEVLEVVTLSLSFSAVKPPTSFTDPPASYPTNQSKVIPLEEKEVEWDPEFSKLAQIVLLGAGESGKSTIFRQVNYLFNGKDLAEKTRLWIHLAIIPHIHALIQENAKLSSQTTGSEEFVLSPRSKEIANYVLKKVSPEKEMKATDAKLIEDLWSDPAFKLTFEKRTNFCIFDTVSYFLDNISLIASPNYIPTTLDCLRVYVRTTGNSRAEIQAQEVGLRFHLWDTGGQRSERRKWKGLANGMSGVIYVISTSQFDETCFEVDGISKLTDALELFEHTMSSLIPQKTPTFVLFNKKDQLQEMYSQGILKNYFPDFKGDTFEDACAYFKNLFTSKLAAGESRQNIWFYFINATDIEDIRIVFGDILKQLKPDV